MPKRITVDINDWTDLTVTKTGDPAAPFAFDVSYALKGDGVEQPKQGHLAWADMPAGLRTALANDVDPFVLSFVKQLEGV